jgi:hypothetical protein
VFRLEKRLRTHYAIHVFELGPEYQRLNIRPFLQGRDIFLEKNLIELCELRFSIEYVKLCLITMYFKVSYMVCYNFVYAIAGIIIGDMKTVSVRIAFALLIVELFELRKACPCDRPAFGINNTRLICLVLFWFLPWSLARHRHHGATAQSSNPEFFLELRVSVYSSFSVLIRHTVSALEYLKVGPAAVAGESTSAVVFPVEVSSQTWFGVGVSRAGSFSLWRHSFKYVCDKYNSV